MAEKKYIVNNLSKKDVTRAGITFKPGTSKPMALSPAKLAQIEQNSELTFADYELLAADDITTKKAKKD